MFKWRLLRNSNNRRTVKSILLVKKVFGLVEMMSGLVNTSLSLPKWQAVIPLINLADITVTLYYNSCQGTYPDWIGGEKEALEGFSWRGGSERDTTGILLWSKPYIKTLPSGEEVSTV